MWLGANRGHLTDWATQQWVKTTGRMVDPDSHSWLDGPIGKPAGIGANFFQQLAKETGLSVEVGSGLVTDFSQLEGKLCRVRDVAQSVIHFYEHTAEYELEAWSEWSGAFKSFGRALALIFSRRLQQLNSASALSGDAQLHIRQVVVHDGCCTEQFSPAPGRHFGFVHV